MNELPTIEQKLICRFKRGDKVRWNALALHGDDRNGWVVGSVEKLEGLFPIYLVTKGKEVGSAVQNELEPCPTYARLQRERQIERVAGPKEDETTQQSVVLMTEIERLRSALKELVEDEWRCTVDWGPRDERQAILDRCLALIGERPAVETEG